MAHPTPDSLALIALGEDVESETLRHVGECRACFAEIEALQQVVAVGRSLGSDEHLTMPHPRVWSRVAEDLHDGRVGPLRGSVGLLEPPAVTPAPVPRRTPVDAAPRDELAARSSRRPRRRATIAVAAATALVVGLVGGFFLKNVVAPAAQVSAVTQLNALPSYTGANGTASIEDGGNGQRTLVVAMDLPGSILVDGTLEVWMSDTHAQDMVPLGAMTGSTARFPLPAAMDVETHPIVDVSLEPRGDNNPSHSDISVVRGRLPV